MNITVQTNENLCTPFLTAANLKKFICYGDSVIIPYSIFRTLSPILFNICENIYVVDYPVTNEVIPDKVIVIEPYEIQLIHDSCKLIGNAIFLDKLLPYAGEVIVISKDDVTDACNNEKISIDSNKQYELVSVVNYMKIECRVYRRH